MKSIFWVTAHIFVTLVNIKHYLCGLPLFEVGTNIRAKKKK